MKITDMLNEEEFAPVKIELTDADYERPTSVYDMTPQQKKLVQMGQKIKASLSPTDVVVFPSPAGVGVIAVTKIKLLFFSFNLSIYSKFNFAICRPIGLNVLWLFGILYFFRTSDIGLILEALAISISDLILAIGPLYLKKFNMYIEFSFIKFS